MTIVWGTPYLRGMSYRNQNIRCLCLACIFCFSFAGWLKGDPKDELKKRHSLVLNYLNGFGFSPEVCLRITNLRNSENYAIWRKCLKCVDLLGDTEFNRETARLCLLLIGAKQINRIPERAAGLRSIITEWGRFFYKPETYRALTHTQKELVFSIRQAVYGMSKHSWKIRIRNRNFTRVHNPTLGRGYSSFDLNADSEPLRRIPRDYPGTM